MAQTMVKRAFKQGGGLCCGALAVALAGLPAAAFAAGSAGAVADAVAPPLPQVVAAVARISPQRIEGFVRTLVGFGTRHTLSDTVSETRGIGAARRWIARELQACSNASGGRLQVTLNSHTPAPSERVPRPLPVVNVVATLPGTHPLSKERLLVVSGHYDSRASDVMDANITAPGANDDASGVAAVMDMACVLAGQSFDATLVFMAVAGEEQGLLGAEHWAEQARLNKLRVEAMITNDIIGSPVGDAGQRDARQVRLFADGLSPLLRLALTPPLTPVSRPGATPDPIAIANASANAAAIEAVREQVQAQARTGGMSDFPTNQLGRYLKTEGERYVPGFTVNLIQRPDRYLRGGDHLPFLARGYAAVRFTEPFENFMHQHQDVRMQNGVQIGDLPEFVDFAYVADVARINLAGLATLALAPAPPQNVRVETLALSNDTTLRWDANPEAEISGYRIVWRDTSSAVWQQQRDVGKVLRATLDGLSKDNLIFGVQALGREGAASLPSYPLPLLRR